MSRINKTLLTSFTMLGLLSTLLLIGTLTYISQSQPNATPPAISILSPENRTYSVGDIPLNFTVDETTSWIGYSLNGMINVTITGNTSMTGLLDGSYNVVVYANDTSGNMGASDAVHFTVDTTPLNISILSPENKTYTVDDVPLNFTISELTSWIGYSLDGQANVTITGNTTLFDLADGSHSIVIYANDTAGNMGVSDKIFFTVAIPPPEYTLEVHSSPTGVPFMVDNASRTTPWLGTFTEGASVSLEMPEIHMVGDAKYHWNQWSDGNTNRSRTVVMDTNITLTASFSGPYYELTVTSSPLTGITFTVDGTPQTTPYTEWLLEGSYTLEMPQTHNRHVWSHWLEDGDTNRTKTVVMDTSITLTAVYKPVATVTIEIHPETLNLKSKGRWITCYIELPEGYNVSDINRATILLNDTIPVDPFWVDKPLESVIGNHDGTSRLMVKFSRTAVSEHIHSQGITYGKVTLTITGELHDGTIFDGSDVTRVIMPGHTQA